MAYLLERRVISLVRSTYCLCRTDFFSISSMSTPIASLPTSYPGCITVVNPGTTTALTGSLLNPTIRSSPGIATPFFCADYQNEFEHIFKKGTVSDDPTIYINITSKLDPSMAPSGKENWFVMVNTPANKGQDWHSLKDQLREVVLQKLGRMLGEEIAPLIVSEDILDPRGIEAQSASFMGSLYGTSSNSRMAAFMRQANESRLVKGLYFCGGSVHPGGGIPLCLKSAAIVSDLVKEAKH